MKYTLSILLLTLHLLPFVKAQPLFKIYQNDRVGYINEKGDVIVNPIFLSGNDFSEGLAAVRLNGKYGFINERGTFVIEPNYDYASNYIHGLTVVFNEGQPLFIDRTGNVILSSVYSGLYLMNSSKGIITTHTRKEGVIDIKTKELIIDTIYSSITNYENGVFIVYEYTEPSLKPRRARVGIIDSTGKIIVPFGKYETINPFFEGFALVKISDNRRGEGDVDGVINTKGKLIFKKSYKNRSYIDGDFHNGYAKISLYKYWIPEEKGVSYTTKKQYDGYINLKGIVVFNDTNYKYVNDFADGRAFIKEESNDYILVDKSFKRVGNNEYYDISSNTFQNGYAIVETYDGFGIIDTSGNFVTRSDFGDIDRVGIVDGFFFFSEDSEEDSEDDRTLYGIADLNGNIIFKPMMQEFDRNGFVNGLIKGIIDDKLSYVNKSGKIVWQEQKDTSNELKSLNIDFMNRGYFYAYSTPKNTEAVYSGGWATSKNRPNLIADETFPSDSLSITIDIKNIDTFANQYFGYALFVSNRTNDTVKFNAQDSRLYLKLQAQNSKGEWKDIEYLPSSWCGNSYHQVELEPNAFWKFTIPKYNGELQTKIRAVLRYIDNENLESEKVVYSNLIDGSVNPGQFWNKRSYYPGGFMDPYYD